jgi:hypothetical protein
VSTPLLPVASQAELVKKPLELCGRDERLSFAELLGRVRDACGATPHARVALQFKDPAGADQLELSDDTELRIALAMLDDAQARARLARRRTRMGSSRASARASQVSRLQLVARVVDESAAPAAAAPPLAPQPHRAPVDYSSSSGEAQPSARGSGYYPTFGTQRAGVLGGACALNAALDGLPREARAVVDCVVWREKVLLLCAPTSYALHAFGA